MNKQKIGKIAGIGTGVILALVWGVALMLIVAFTVPLDGPVIFEDVYKCGTPSGLPISFLDTSKHEPSNQLINYCLYNSLYNIDWVAFSVNLIFWSTITYFSFYFVWKFLKKHTKISYAFFVALIVVFSVFLLSYIAFAQETISSDLENLHSISPEDIQTYDKINIRDAWQAINNSNTPLSSTVIGIVDTGVDVRHQEFTDPDINFGSSPANALRDFLEDSEDGHGTQVAGIIGANNILGAGGTLPPDTKQMNGILSGVLPEDKYILEVENFLSRNASLHTFPEIYALEQLFTNERNPSIVNMSFGAAPCSARSFFQNKCYTTDKEFFDAVEAYTRFFRNKPEVLFVAAAGNANLDAGLHVPAAVVSDNLISVAALDVDDTRFKRVNFFRESNFGDRVHIAAPGNKVYTPQPNNEYDHNFNETSASAPFVTGVAGLIKAIQPGFTPERIKSVLTNSADPIKTGEPQKTMGNACHSNPDIIPQQKTGTTACRLNAESAVKTVTPFYNYKMDFVSVGGNTPPSPGCNTNRQGQPVSFFDDFDDGSTNTGCTALFSQLGTFNEEAGHLTLNSNDAVSSTGFRVHTATLQTPFQEGDGNSQIEVSFKSDTPFGASENGFSNYGLFLRENVSSNIPALSIQAGSIEGRAFLNAIQFPEVITSQAFLSLSDLDNLVLKIELNDTSNLATPLFSIDNGNTFIPFRNPDNTIFRVPAFRESSDASLQVFGSLFLPQTPAQTQSQLLLPQNLPYTPVIVE